MRTTKTIERRMRVLHVASGDLWAGAESQLFQLVHRLDRYAGIEVGVALLNEGELARRLTAAGIRTWILDEKVHSTAILFAQLLRIVRAFSPDVIHTHRSKENLLGGLACMVHRRAVSLRTVHGGQEHQPQSVFSRRFLATWLDRFVGRHLQRRIVAVSTRLAADLQRTFGASRVACIHNGIDIAAVRKAAADPRVRLSSQINVGIVGRQVAVKRVDLFLDVARELHRRTPNRFRFYIVGDGPLLEQMRERAASHGISEICEFMGFRPDAAPIIGQLACLVIPSDHEGLPMVLLEALALGVPSVTHAVGGMTEVVRSARQGLLVPSQNIQSFADAILEVTQQYGTGKERDNLLDRQFEIDTTVSSYVALYDTLVGARTVTR